MLGCPDFREGRQYGFMIVFGIWGESNKILLKIYPCKARDLGQRWGLKDHSGIYPAGRSFFRETRSDFSCCNIIIKEHNVISAHQ